MNVAFDLDSHVFESSPLKTPLVASPPKTKVNSLNIITQITIKMSDVSDAQSNYSYDIPEGSTISNFIDETNGIIKFEQGINNY
jgi:hypothetical protein